MRESFWERVGTRICHWFGHREEFSQLGQCVVCRRCCRLLRGPLNFTEKDRATYPISPTEGRA